MGSPERSLKAAPVQRADAQLRAGALAQFPQLGAWQRPVEVDPSRIMLGAVGTHLLHARQRLIELRLALIAAVARGERLALLVVRALAAPAPADRLLPCTAVNPLDDRGTEKRIRVPQHQHMPRLHSLPVRHRAVPAVVRGRVIVVAFPATAIPTGDNQRQPRRLLTVHRLCHPGMVTQSPTERAGGCPAPCATAGYQSRCGLSSGLSPTPHGTVPTGPAGRPNSGFAWRRPVETVYRELKRGRPSVFHLLSLQVTADDKSDDNEDDIRHYRHQLDSFVGRAKFLVSALARPGQCEGRTSRWSAGGGYKSGTDGNDGKPSLTTDIGR